MELNQQLQQIRDMAQTIIQKIDAVAGSINVKKKHIPNRSAQDAIEKRRKHIEKTIQTHQYEHATNATHRSN